MIMPRLPRLTPLPRWLFMVGGAAVLMCSLLLLIWATGRINDNIAQKLETQLRSLTNERATLFELWITERKSDIYTLQHDPLLRQTVQAYAENPHTEAQEDILLERFQSLIAAYPYRQISLYTPSSERLLRVSMTQTKTDPDNVDLVKKATLSKDVEMSEIYIQNTDGTAGLTLDMSVPLIDPKNDTLIAVVLLKVDPNPVIKSALSNIERSEDDTEVIIGQRQDDSVVIIDPRFQEGQNPSLLTFSLHKDSLPAAMVARGQWGLIEGNDYKDLPVIAYARPLGESHWFILSKVARNSAQTLKHEILLALTAFAILSLAVAGLLYGNYRNLRRRQGLETALSDQREQADLLRKLIESERELHSSQQQLAHSELRFRTIMDSSPIPCSLIDRGGAVSYINPAFEQTFGYAYRDISTVQAWHERAYPDPEYSRWVSEQWRQRLKVASEQGRFDPLEVHVRCKDGSMRTIVAEAAYLAGLDSLYVCTLYDITSRKQMEAELSALSAEYAHVIRSLPVGLFRYRLQADGKQGFDYMSDLWCEQLNTTRDAVLSNPQAALNALNDEDAASFWNFKKSSDRFRWRARTKEIHGGRWLEIEATPQEMDTGDVVWTGVQSDITSRKTIEDTLAFERQSLLNILWATDVGTWEWEMHTGALRINERWADIAGYTRKELEPISIESWNALVHPDDGARSFQLLEQHFKGETPFYECEVRLRHKDGRWIWILDRGKVISRDKDGAPVSMAGTHLDITQRKEVEKTLDQQRSELSRSNAELEQFAYAVSHDLRQPLRMVHSYVQLLERRLKDVLNDDTRLMMSYARDGAMRMDTMLVSLLEYSRVGRRGAPMELISSKDAIIEALQFLEPAIAECSATVSTPDTCPEVYASRDELTRLFQNLIGNALKYRTEGCAPIITLAVQPDPQGWKFSITDNGIGIDPEQFDRLFKVFQRLQSKEKYEGSGVGLAVCKKIVERHGGTIWVESPGEGQGSTFCFTLPQPKGHSDH